MRFLLFILLLTSVTSVVVAQTEKHAKKIESAIDSTISKTKERVRLSKVDSLNHKLGELQGKIGNDKDTIVKVAKELNLKLDSLQTFSKLRGKLNDGKDTIGQVTKSLKHKLDSIQDFTKYTKRVDSIKARLTNKIDSLTTLRLPTAHLSKKLDSLKEVNPLKNLEKVQVKIQQAQSNLTDKISEPSKKLNEKLSLLTKESDGQGNLPSNVIVPRLTNVGLTENIPTINSGRSSIGTANQTNTDLTKNIPAASSGIPNLSSNVGSANLPQTDLTTSLSSNSLGTAAIPSIHDPLGKGINNAKKEVSKEVNGQIGPGGNLNIGGDIKNIQSSTQDVSKEMGNVDAYSQDIKSISEGNTENLKKIDKDIIAALPSEEVGKIQTNIGALKQQETAIKSFRDPEAFKKQTLQKGKEMAMLQFAAQEKQIQSVVAKISEYQRNADNLIRQVKNLPKQRPPRESIPPLIERFIPSITLQVDKSSLWKIDINPAVRFRLKKLISIGVGYNERIVLDESPTYRAEHRIYGIRNFLEVTVRKSFAIRLDIEQMNTFVPASFQQQDVGERKWVWSYMLGAKKEFSFGSGVLGNIQFMYNLFDPKRESPYQNRFNVRFGFEFPPKVKRRIK
jgi:hypothetical protein